MTAGALARRLRRWLVEIALDVRLEARERDLSRDPATPEQLQRIDRLCDDRGLVSPAWQPLSQRQAVTIATGLLDGTYNPQAWE